MNMCIISSWGCTGVGYPFRANRGYHHRLTWEKHNGRKLEKGEVVMHLCNNKRCINPEHLQVGTPAENTAQAVKDGLIRFGVSHGSSRLTEQQVREIRKRSDAGERVTSLAKEYGVAYSHVSNIVARRVWKHLTDGGNNL